MRRTQFGADTAMTGNWLSIVIAAAAFAGTREGVDQYRKWKTARTEIPMERQRDGTYVVDGKLKRFEKRFMRAFWTFLVFTLLTGYILVAGAAGDLNFLEHWLG